MLAQFPILQVILPLLAAPLAALMRRGDWAWRWSALITGGAFLIACALMAHLRAGGAPLHYDLGGWPAPLGIAYVIDPASAFMLPLISGICFVITLAARRLVHAEIDPRDHGLFYAAWLLTIAGMLGQIASGDAFNIFVFLEIASLSAYALVAMGAGRDRRALPAAFKYLILGTVGASFYVIGVGLIYMLTGTLNLADLAARLPQADPQAAFVALAFIVLGLLLKMALFPLHFWLTPAYGYAPSAVSALMAATATKVAVYLLIRIMFGVFGVALDGQIALLGKALLVLGLIGAFAGTLAAIIERDVKRVLAQSSVAQLGYMAMAIGLATEAGLSAAFIHIFNHALMKGALFLAVGLLAAQMGSVTLDTLRGAGKAAPMSVAAILVGGLALIGVPFTAGFISKLYLIRAQLDLGLWLIALLTVMSSALALAYVWRIIEAAYMHPRPQAAPTLTETPARWLPAWLLIAATLFFGIYPAPLIAWASRAAAWMLGGAP